VIKRQSFFVLIFAVFFSTRFHFLEPMWTDSRTFYQNCACVRSIHVKRMPIHTNFVLPPYPSDLYLMTSRELTSGFDFWSRGHLCMAVMPLPIKFGARFSILDLLGEPWDHLPRATKAYSWCVMPVKILSWLAKWFSSYRDLTFLSFRLESPIHVSKNFTFWGFYPQNSGEHHSDPPKGMISRLLSCCA